MTPNHLRWLLLITIPVYTLWMGFMLTVGQVVNPLGIAANVVMGLLAGALAVFLADHDAPRLFLRDGLLNVAFFAVLTTLYAAFSLRGGMTFVTVDPLTNMLSLNEAGLLAYLGGFAGRGALVGLLLWLLGSVNTGYALGGTLGSGVMVGATLIGLLAAPLAANVLFDGALVVVVAMSTRLAAGLALTAANDWWKGFIFGTLAGVTMVLLPFIAYFSGGTL